MLAFDSGGKGNFSLAISVADPGTYTIAIYYTRAQDFGEVQLSVDGRTIGDRADTFKKIDDLTRPIWPPKRFDFEDVRLKQGENVLKFAITSKNPDSEGHRMAVDCMVLKRQRE